MKRKTARREDGRLVAYLLALRELADMRERAATLHPRARWRARVLERARRLYGSDECEIDDDAIVSPAGPRGDELSGNWVQAWVWVCNQQVKEK